jgi:hypothetical protein
MIALEPLRKLNRLVASRVIRMLYGRFDATIMKYWTAARASSSVAGANTSKVAWPN